MIDVQVCDRRWEIGRADTLFSLKGFELPNTR